MKVVGFDLDDTLVPEVLFLKSGAHHIAGWLHERYPALPYFRILTAVLTAVETRQNHYTALERIAEEFHIAGSIDMKETVAEFRRHIPDPAVYHTCPSMLGILKRLKETSDIRLVLITDGRSLTQRNKIHAAGLYKFFDDADIYISEETGHDKTSPETFLRIMEKYPGASEYHFVGDNPSKDFLHPSRLGWLTHQAHPFPLMIHSQGMPK